MDDPTRALAALALLAGLAGCGSGSTGGDYPRGWPAPVPGAADGGSCADLSGRYAVGDGVLAAIFDRPRGAEDHGIDWHTLEIADDGAGRLTLEFVGSGIGDDRDATPKRSSRPLGSTTCQEGWVRSRLALDAGEPVERADDDPRVVERYALIARDADGNLIAQDVVERYRTWSFWAPGGADARIPLTGSLERRWSRWLVATDPAERARLHRLAADPSPTLGKLGRILPSDVEILSHRTDGDGHVLELRVADVGALTALQERLLESSELGDGKLTLDRRLPDGRVDATLRVGSP